MLESDEPSRHEFHASSADEIAARLLETSTNPERVAEDVEYLFADAKPAMESLMDELSEPIKDQNWSSILADARSGILPARIIGDASTLYAEANNLRPPGQLAIASGIAANPDER